jgi:IS30 family transposase
MINVKDRFRKDFPPDRTAGRLKAEYLQQTGTRVSQETVYRYLYGEADRDPELKGRFQHPRRKWMPRSGGPDIQGQTPGQNPIGPHPATVDKKVRTGDWEGDTMKRSWKTGYIAAFAGKTAKLLRGAVMLDRTAVREFLPVPGEYVKTLAVTAEKTLPVIRSCHGNRDALFVLPVLAIHGSGDWMGTPVG